MVERTLPTDDDLFSEWVTWIEEVYSEIVNLAWSRRLFRHVGRVFEKNQELQYRGGHLLEWMTLNYAAYAAMSLRRDLDRANHRGLVHLLYAIAQRPQVLSRRRYYECWGPLRHSYHERRRERDFERVAFIHPSVNPMDDHIDPAEVQGDIRELRATTKLVQDYIEQTIAHRTRGTPEPLTFERFDAALDARTPIFQKYYARLTLKSVRNDPEPVAQFNIHEPFTFPWDATCYDVWRDHMKGKRLDWQQIRSVYGEDIT